MKKAILSGMMAVCMLTAAAGAETFSGTVAARRSVEVYAPIGGTIESVNVQVGEAVTEGQSIAHFDVTEVYASEAGTITGIFGEPGDDSDTIKAKYGAVMYIEGESVYTISASTDNAYNSAANRFVHVGETVYLSCYSDGDHTGKGVITAINGTDYTVDVTSGSFLVPETVNIYRGSSATASKRIGRGTLTRKSTTAVTGSGAIVSINVQNGDKVEKGQLLMTTLNGSYDGYYMSGTDIVSSVSGTVASVNVSQGGKAEKGSVAAVIYPAGEMRVEAEVSEYDLDSIKVGDKVTVELLWSQDSDVSYEGTVTMISAVATSSSASAAGSMGSSSESETTYTVYVDFTPDESTRYGMSAVVSTLDEKGEEEDEEEEEPVGEETAEEDDTETQALSQKPEGFDPSNMPEGFDASNMPEGFDPSNMPEGFDPSQMQVPASSGDN